MIVCLMKLLGTYSPPNNLGFASICAFHIRKLWSKLSSIENLHSQSIWFHRISNFDVLFLTPNTTLIILPTIPYLDSTNNACLNTGVYFEVILVNISFILCLLFVFASSWMLKARVLK